MSADAASCSRGDALVTTPELAADALLARASGENFPVAPRWLARGNRDDLLSIYAYARLVDQIGDEIAGDRLGLLDAVSRDLERAFSGRPQHPVLQRLASTIQRHDLPRGPFERLLEANRRDQLRVRIATWEDLLEYCSYSANPVGELVLRVLGRAEARSIRLSNAVCSALQVVEHCQDVAEDFRSGRVYLPAVDLARAECPEEELARAPASPALRGVVALQIARARGLLALARPLVAALTGRARWLVAAYAAGGLAACDALARASYDPNTTPVRGRRRDRFRHSLALCWNPPVRSSDGSRP